MKKAVYTISKIFRALSGPPEKMIALTIIANWTKTTESLFMRS